MPTRISCLLLVFFLFSGCGTRKLNLENGEDSFNLTIELESNQYQQGEAIIVTVHLKSLSDRDQTLHQLNKESLDFWWMQGSTKSPVLREPVASPLENLQTNTPIPAGSSIKRQFVLLSCTELEGQHSLQCMYSSAIEEGETLHLYSSAIPFEVSEERSMERDSEGVLTKPEAIRFAQIFFNQEYQYSDARLVRNEMGFLDWWVTLTNDREKALETGVACFVSPYTGAVRTEAKPDPRSFQTTPAEPERLKRPIPQSRIREPIQ